MNHNAPHTAHHHSWTILVKKDPQELLPSEGSVAIRGIDTLLARRLLRRKGHLASALLARALVARSLVATSRHDCVIELPVKTRTGVQLADSCVLR